MGKVPKKAAKNVLQAFRRRNVATNTIEHCHKDTLSDV